MQCQTVRPGTECTFWSKAGCNFESATCQNVIEACEGCERIIDSTIGTVCEVYPAPMKKWLGGLCNFATHQKVEIKLDDLKVNPLKASKRAAAAKKK